MARFDISYTTAYWSSIVSIALSCIISEIKRDIGRKSQFLSYPLHSMPPLGWTPSEYCSAVWSIIVSKVSKSIYIRRLKARVTRRRSLVLDKQKRFQLSSVLGETVRRPQWSRQLVPKTRSGDIKWPVAQTSSGLRCDACDGARRAETATGLRRWLARVWEIRRYYTLTETEPRISPIKLQQQRIWRWQRSLIK